MNPLAIALIVFTILLFLGMPVIFVMAFSSVIYCLVADKLLFLMVVVEKMFRGMDSFVLLAIPLFIMCGEVMNCGGITRAIVRLCNLLVGRLRGGLAYVNVLDSTFFAGITGSALSDIASLGSIMIPAMEEQGYDKDFSCAVTAATAIQGPLIPPSIPAVLVASATGLSTGALFWGGAVPGVMIGIGCAIIIFFMSRMRNFPKREEYIGFVEGVKIIIASIIPLMTIGIIMIGINSGYFTPTEAAVIALAYAILITATLYGGLSFKKIIEITRTSLLQTSTIYLIIAGATCFSYVLAIENIPSKLAVLINSFATSQVSVLIIINLILLVWGMFMDTSPSILVLVPILYPVAAQAGIHPIHFGVIVVTNLMIGLLTPPFGMALYTTRSVGKCEMLPLIKAILPFIIMNMIVLGLITFVPEIVLFLPRVFGFI